MRKVVIKILRGNVVTQTLATLANFLQCTCAKNYESWLTVDKVIAVIKSSAFVPPYIHC